jgi:Holliday junction DNA helicase RuvA
MITSIQGTLAESALIRAVIEVDGFGYEVNVPVTTAERLPAVGSVVKLHTLVIYREDSQTLYGFATSEDRDFFRLMIENVTGIGPKGALSIMSRLSLPLLQGAIRAGDIATLSKAPGIGKKTAERLVIELKGRVGGAAVGVRQAPADGDGAPKSPHADAVAALVALGYKVGDADEAVRRASLSLGASATTEALIRKSLA